MFETTASRDETPAIPATVPTIEKILVVVDPSASEYPCIEKAARIASRLGSAMELFICDAEPAPPDSWAGPSKLAEYREVRRQRFAQSLVELATPLRARGLIVTTACTSHALLESGIGEHVVRTSPDLVVKDVALDDKTLIAQIAAPLLLVRPQQWPAQLRIAVATDPCHPAERPESLDEALIATSCLLANATGGNAQALHVLQSPPHLPNEPVPSIERARAYGAARDAVERLVVHASNLAAPMPVHFLEGGVAHGITEFVTEHQPDLLVLGAAARERRPGSIAGETAARIQERVSCDVLIIKPRGFVSPLLISDED